MALREKTRLTLDLTRYQDQILDISGYFKGRVGDTDDYLPVYITSNSLPVDMRGWKYEYGGVDNQGHAHKHIYPVEGNGRNDQIALGRITLHFDERTFNVPGHWQQFYIRFIGRDGSTVSTVDMDFDVIDDQFFARVGDAGRDYIDEFEKILEQVTNQGDAINDKLNKAGETYSQEFSEWLAKYKQSLNDAMAEVNDPKDGLYVRYNQLLEMTKQIQETLKQAQFHDRAWQFNDVPTMQGYAPLAAGDLAITKGWDDYDDGHGAVWQIRVKHKDEVPDGTNVIALSNGVVAERNTSIVTADSLEEFKKSMENQTVNDFSLSAITDPQNMYAEGMPPYFNNTFNYATNVPHGDNIVNIAFITDNHHQEDAHPWTKWAYSGKSLEHYQWFAQGTLRTKPDVAIANGDNINGDTYRPTLIWTTMHIWAMLSTVYLKTALFVLPGNHDTGIGQTPKLVAKDAMTEDDLKTAYHTVKPLYGEVRNGDSLYFYKDLTDKKVRVIGLNSSDMPWTTDSQGNYVHNRLEEAGFSVAQLKWLVDVALKLPDNSWQVVFFFHHPLSTSTFYNAQALIDIIKAFKNGGSVVINRSDVDDMQIVGLKADFTTQGARTVIGVFNGHYHADSQDLTTLNGTPIVITDASLSNSIGEQLKRRNTPNEDCWETISIDTNARTIHCYRFGRGADREFTY